jgi:hypothetical protein
LVTGERWDTCCRRIANDINMGTVQTTVGPKLLYPEERQLPPPATLWCRAYGNKVSDFLLSMNTHPAWLLTILNLMCVFQLLVGEQVRTEADGGVTPHLPCRRCAAAGVDHWCLLLPLTILLKWVNSIS